MDPLGAAAPKRRASLTACSVIMPGLVLLLHSACSGQDLESQIVERDSAGIRVVSSPPPFDGLTRLTLAGEAELIIGTRAGDSAFVLHLVHDARLLSDGRIVVANGPELLWFEPDGRFQGRGGGRGGGPAEFRAVVGVEVLAGDTVLALNSRPPSAKLFAPAGTYSRSFPVPPLPVHISRLGSGHWAGLAFLGEPAPRQVGIFREQWAVVLLDSTLSAPDTLLSLGGRMLYGDQRRSVHVPASPRVFIAAQADRVVAGSSDRYELNVFDPTGRQILLIRNTIPNPPVALEHDDESRPQRRPPPEGGGSGRTLEPPLPERAPTYDAILVANVGGVWVRRHGGGTPDREWHVYDRDGRLNAVATLPANFQPTEITPSHVLGIWRDELDVESVRMFRLVR